MSKALEAAARAVDPPAWQAGRDEKPWGTWEDRQTAARGIARAAILAFLREVDASELGAAVRDADNPTHAAIARALIKALTRLAEEPTP